MMEEINWDEEKNNGPYEFCTGCRFAKEGMCKDFKGDEFCEATLLCDNFVSKMPTAIDEDEEYDSEV